MAILNVNLEFPCRLDRYLKKVYPGLTQGVVERALRLKQITVNACKVAANFRVNTGNQIFLKDSLNLESHETSAKVFASSVAILAGKMMKQYLIYQNEWFIAINKPAGIASQGGSKISISINDALQYLNSQGTDFKLIHRLDKNTSGILLIAKNYASSIKLVKAFQNKHIQKTYIALVLGNLLQSEGEISSMIGKNRSGAYKTVQNDEEHGKLAITRYKLLKSFNNRSFAELAYANNFTLIEFTPMTGRMHQLRFHAKMLGHPIIGDTKYGTQEAMALSKKMLLHATKVILSDKIFGKEIIINIELPRYFTDFCDEVE